MDFSECIGHYPALTIAALDHGEKPCGHGAF